MTRIAWLGAVVAFTAVGAQLAPGDTPVGGLICSNTTWTPAGSPYIVTPAAGGSILIGCGATLTIQAGVEVRFDPNMAMTVGSAAYGSGTVVARGTADARIRFTSNTTQQPGAWIRIYFTTYAVDAVFDDGVYQSGSVLEYVTVEYAGGGNVPAVTLEQSSPWLSHCEIHDNLKRGMYVYNAPSVRIENCNVSNNHDGGIYVNGGSSHLLSGNTVVGNSTTAEGGGMRFDWSNSNTISGNTVVGNSAASAGAGVYFHYASSNTISGNTVAGNSAISGGGMYFSYGGNNTISGNTVVDNNASAKGAAVCLEGADNVTFTNCVITGNRITGSATTGGIYAYANAQQIRLAGDPNHPPYNTICGNDGYQVRNDNPFRADGLNDIDARYVNWCTCDTLDIYAAIYDYFDDVNKAIVIWYPFIQSLGPGDLNCDCLVNFADINPFVLALSGQAAYQAQYPNCDWHNGDCNGDGQVNFADINPFVALLSGAY